MGAKQSYQLSLHLTLMQLSNGCVNVDDLCLNVHLLACDTVLHGRLEAESTKALLDPKQPFPFLTRALPGSEIGPAGWCSSCRRPLRPTRRDCHTHDWLHSVPRAAPSHLHPISMMAIWQHASRESKEAYVCAYIYIYIYIYICVCKYTNLIKFGIFAQNRKIRLETYITVIHIHSVTIVRVYMHPFTGT